MPKAGMHEREFAHGAINKGLGARIGNGASLVPCLLPGVNGPGKIALE